VYEGQILVFHFKIHIKKNYQLISQIISCVPDKPVAPSHGYAPHTLKITAFTSHRVKIKDDGKNKTENYLIQKHIHDRCISNMKSE
jgi:hypothetical protein